MLGPYDYPSYIDDQFGWQARRSGTSTGFLKPGAQEILAVTMLRCNTSRQDWPTTYVRGVQNIDSGQQQQQLNRLRPLA